MENTLLRRDNDSLVNFGDDGVPVGIRTYEGVYIDTVFLRYLPEIVTLFDFHNIKFN